MVSVLSLSLCCLPFLAGVMPEKLNIESMLSFLTDLGFAEA